MLDNYSDIKIGDIIETFEEVKTERSCKYKLKLKFKCLHKDK